jgi:hypothetical protein
MTLLSDLQLMLYMHVSAQTFAMTLLSELLLMLNMHVLAQGTFHMPTYEF